MMGRHMVVLPVIDSHKTVPKKMSAYQNFLDFFSMHNKERLDGLSESYFSAMSPEERVRAFEYMQVHLAAGGTEEIIHGLFRADPDRAAEVVEPLLKEGKLSVEAQIAAAWNLHQFRGNNEFLPVFIQHMSNPDGHMRAKAAYYVPALFTEELKAGLQGVIRTETEQLARINAVEKLLECYGVTEETVGKEQYLRIFRNLHNEDVSAKERAFRELETLFE
jgi:hypothetical protein